MFLWGSQVALVVKNLPHNAGNAGDLGSIPGLRGSPGERTGYPLQYSCLGNPMDRETWWVTMHGVAKEPDTAACLGTCSSRLTNNKGTLPWGLLGCGLKEAGDVACWRTLWWLMFDPFCRRPRAVGWRTSPSGHPHRHIFESPDTESIRVMSSSKATLLLWTCPLEHASLHTNSHHPRLQDTHNDLDQNASLSFTRSYVMQVKCYVDTS